MSRYDIAFSFARSARPLVRTIAAGLSGNRVFFDEYETSAIWGRELTEALPDRYLNAMLCVVVLTDDYLTRVWPSIERDVIFNEAESQGAARAVLCLQTPNSRLPVPKALRALVYQLEAGAELSTALKLIRDRWGEIRAE